MTDYMRATIRFTLLSALTFALYFEIPYAGWALVLMVLCA